MSHRHVSRGAEPEKPTRLVSDLWDNPMCDGFMAVARSQYVTPLRERLVALKRGLPKKKHLRIHTLESLAHDVCDAAPDAAHLPNEYRDHYEKAEREQEATSRYFLALRMTSVKLVNRSGVCRFDANASVIKDNFAQASNPDPSLIVASDTCQHMSVFSVIDAIRACRRYVRECFRIVDIELGIHDPAAARTQPVRIRADQAAQGAVTAYSHVLGTNAGFTIAPAPFRRARSIIGVEGPTRRFRPVSAIWTPSSVPGPVLRQKLHPRSEARLNTPVPIRPP